MRKLVTLALFGAILGAAGCVEPGHYPISGQECAPTDPVMGMDANDCTVPTK